MQMNPSIILAGQQPDFVNVLRQSTAGASEANQVQRQNALNQLYQQQGGNIAAGDQNALNQLAQFDPRAALGIQSNRQGLESGQLSMDATRQRMDILNEQEKRSADEYARGLSAADRTAQAERIRQGLMRGVQLHQAGDLPGLNAMLQSVGEPPLQSLDEFPGLAVRYDGVLKALTDVREFNNPDQGQPLSAAGKTAWDLNKGFLTEDQYAQEAGGKDSAAEQKISRIIETHGVDRKTAVGIVDGVLNISRHPLDGSIVITDLATGEARAPTQPNPPPNREGIPERSNSFDGTNPRAAVGVRGMAASAANTILDSVGLGQVAPDVDRAQTALDSLATRTVQGLSAQWPGRPSNLTREMIENMTVRPGDFTTGPGRAANKVTDMMRELARAISAADKVANSQGQYSNTQIAEAQAALNDLLPLYQDYQDLSASLDGASTAGTGQTKSGIKWSVEQ